MTLHPTDADLVAAHLGGDRAALGAIYDRYGGSLYDTAAAMLRDRDEAADVVQEVFLVAAAKLSQLRQPERLEPWLFAVLRNEVYLRSGRRGRARPTDFSTGDDDMVAPADPRAEAADVEREELAELVRAAAAGLDERDQLVMELSLRQDLAGGDLADAVGVTTKQAHVLVHRMRERLLRSLGAITVARMGRDDCDELAALLGDWDGTFSVLLRKRVARHVERCDICDETRSKHPVGALFGAAPAFAAPTDLRDRVLTSVERGATPTHDHPLDGDGFPRPPRRAPGGLCGPRLGVAALVLLVVGLLVGLTLRADDAEEVNTAAPVDSPSTTDPPTTTRPAATSTTTTQPSTTETTETAPATDPVVSTTVAPSPGRLVVSRSLVDLGASAATGSVELSNPGGRAVSWSVGRNGSNPFVWEGVSGTLAAGASTRLDVSVDRDGLAEGSYAGDFTFTGGGATSTLQVRARVERAPVISDVRGPTSLSCPSSTSDVVLATVTDEGDVDSVVLSWAGPGSPGRTAMLDLGADWEGILEPDQEDGQWTFTVTATDDRGNSSSTTRPFVVSGCS